MSLRSPLNRSVFFSLLLLGASQIRAEKLLVLETAGSHYHVYYEKKHEAVAGEALKIAETVWPVLAKAYDAYDNFQTIDIFIKDPGDYANGQAIYEFSRVEIFVPHLNWVMRGRGNWLSNVVTHEIAHVFSLRQKARLWIFSDATVGGTTFNRGLNWSFLLPWVPLPAPNWWIEGIAQFEAAEAGYDSWDSQRDMIVRDAWLTHSLPTLGQIETFDGAWIQGERVYNTGFAFLRHLRDRYGLEKMRRLAFPKPWFHFGGAFEEVFRKSLSEAYADWRVTLAEKYGDFKDLGKDTLFDRDIEGSFTQNLAFSPDGGTMAWLGNGDRDYPLNWIYWKEIQKPGIHRSGKSVMGLAANPGKFTPGPGPALPDPGFSPLPMCMATHPLLRRAPSVPAIPVRRVDPPNTGRSEEISSAGLEFNQDGSRLLTTRNDFYSNYNDIWEYEFRAKKSEEAKWHRLTWNIRATYASYHPTQAHTVVFSQFDDGSSNVAVLDSSGRTRVLTRFREGQQVYNPRFTARGDSIYFTLGMGDTEAIAAVSAKAPGFEAFASLEDSAIFPDSLFLAKGQKLRFVTPLSQAAIRDLRFTGDTLVFSSNVQDGVYNVFARFPGDSLVYRLTRNRTQALEPLVRNGTLYYQGYERQQFRIFRQTLDPVPAGPWPKVTDSLAALRPKKKDYAKAAASDEPTVRKVAWSISPFINISPQFLDDTTLSDLNVDLGIQVALGPLSGGLSQAVSAYISKRTDLSTPVDYGVAYQGNWSGVTAWHQRFGWTPNLDYMLSRDVRHANFTDNILDTVISNVGTDPLRAEGKIQHQLTYTYQQISAAMALPLNGQRVGGGFLQTLWYGRYWNQNLLYDVSENVGLTNLRTGEQQQFSDAFRVVDASVHWHLYQQAGFQWYMPAYGTPLPRYLGFFADAGQWWARYALDPVGTGAVDSALSLQAGTPISLNQLPKSDFSPWQTDFGWFWSWSKGENFQIAFENLNGFFTHKFPMVTDTLVVYPASVTGPEKDTVVASIHPNLWVMPYRLGLYMMPGYPYSFTYRGRDVLRGSAVGWARMEIALPVKIRQFLDYPSPFSSLNKVQLSLISDAGTVLTRTPDQLADALENGEHHLLLDYGAKLGFTFLFYHWLPMELYGTFFMPYNQLRAHRLFQSDWRDRGYASAEDYLDYVKQPRLFIGLTIGRL